jgi:PPOX class probable F420-dependent enzyme
MDHEDALRFAATIGRGTLATNKSDGRPQLSNVMFAVRADGVVRVSVTDGRAKTANMRRDPRVSLHVTSPDFWSYAVIEGDSDLSPVAESADDAAVAELVELYRALRGEHDDWDEYRRTMVADRRLVARIRPTRAYGLLPRRVKA